MQIWVNLGALSKRKLFCLDGFEAGAMNARRPGDPGAPEL
jgi:hypothetical protein